MTDSDSEADTQSLRELLLGAIGYLAKLGTNMRLRAEHLQKRKMENTHSVRKNTDKVLSICDLSKQTLVKIEGVVKKALLSDSRSGKVRTASTSSRRNSIRMSTEGAHGSSRIEKPNKPRKIGKFFLKIPDKVQLAHFTSCSVEIHAIPQSSLQKYTVYSEELERKKTDKVFASPIKAVSVNRERREESEEQTTSITKIAEKLENEKAPVPEKLKLDKKEDRPTKPKDRKRGSTSQSKQSSESDDVIERKSKIKLDPMQENNSSNTDDEKVEKLKNFKIPKKGTTKPSDTTEDCNILKLCDVTDKNNSSVNNESKRGEDHKDKIDNREKADGKKEETSKDSMESSPKKNMESKDNRGGSKERKISRDRANNEENVEQKLHKKSLGSKESTKNGSAEKGSDKKERRDSKKSDSSSSTKGPSSSSRNHSTKKSSPSKKRRIITISSSDESDAFREESSSKIRSDETSTSNNALLPETTQLVLEKSTECKDNDKHTSDLYFTEQHSVSTGHTEQDSDKIDNVNSEMALSGSNTLLTETNKLVLEKSTEYKDKDTKKKAQSANNLDFTEKSSVSKGQSEKDSDKTDNVNSEMAHSESAEQHENRETVGSWEMTEKTQYSQEKSKSSSEDRFSEEIEKLNSPVSALTENSQYSQEKCRSVKTLKNFQEKDKIKSLAFKENEEDIEKMLTHKHKNEQSKELEKSNENKSVDTSTIIVIDQTSESKNDSVETSELYESTVKENDKNTEHSVEKNGISVDSVHANTDSNECVQTLREESSILPSTLVSDNNGVKNSISPEENAKDSVNNDNSNSGNEESSKSKGVHLSPENDDSQGSQTSENRPFIKCIDLSKLLKSPVKESLLVETRSVEYNIHKMEKSKDKKKEKLDKGKSNKPRKEYRPMPKKIKVIEIEDSDSDTQSNKTVISKRDDVANFKPKSFTVNITKLPSFTKKFLEKHSLSRITEAGSSIAQLCESVQINDTAKTDLLNESSDSSQSAKQHSKRQSSEERRKKSKSLSSEESKKSKRQTSEDSLKSNKSQSSKESHKDNKIHSSEEVSKDSKNKLSEESHKTKRKHLLESIRAKKLLLTYSSSSDSDDGTPRKQHRMKDSLHKHKERKSSSSGEKEEVMEKMPSDKERHKKRLLASSSSSISDEDTINNTLKKLEKEMNVDEQRTKESDTERSSSKEIDNEKKLERASSKTSSISQVDGNDDNVTGSENEMGRTTRGRSNAASAQNSDATENDDKVVDGLSNLKSLHKKKSRDSPSTTSESSRKKSKNESKKSAKMEVLLEEPGKSSSDLDSEVTEASAPVEGNGDAIGELARADLLEDTDSESTRQTPPKESDSSSKSNGDLKESKRKSRKSKPSKVVELDSTDDEDTKSEENLKVRRRKVEIVSSESEAEEGKSKKEEKDSDYAEASAASDDSAEHFKRSKRKAKKSSDSDSAKSSTEGTKKKRRRIKPVDDSDGSDSDNDGKKGGRKNIRKVMGKDQLEEATKKAAREERERIARITERQKIYNSTAFDESGKPDEIKMDKVVLDFDPETKEPLIEVDRGIVKKLKPHQANGIKFMWDACFESVKQIKKGRGSGCILAHCMGLGKTLQVVSLIHSLLTHEDLTGVHRVLVVCPLSTVLNWVHEIRMWTAFAKTNKDLDIYELSRFKQNHERSYQLREWMETGGVCVLGYEMFRNLSTENTKKYKKKMLATLQESLVNPGPDLVICDEGHLLKNEKTSLSQAMNKVKTLRRIVLTGTPLQNNLKEYYCMVQFVKPNLLGKYNEYLNRFVNPITNGQYTNSTDADIRVMKRRSHVLHKMLDGAVQRRDYSVLAPFLPPKHEYVLFITLTEIQIKLYQHYLDNYSRRLQAGGRSALFPDYQALQRIWTHPLVLKANSERYEIAQQKKRDREEEEDSEGSLVDFLDDDSSPEETTTEEELDDSDASDDSRKKSKKKSSKKRKSKSDKGDKSDKDSAASSALAGRRTRANPGEAGEILDIDMKDLKDPDEPRAENPTEWWIKMVEEKELEDLRNSNKLVLLFEILRQCEQIGDKLLVFSQSLYSLDLIEHFLGKIDDATQMGKVEESLGNHVGSWSPGIDYFRLDGSTSCENRSIWCKNFNKETNPRARLFLISTRAGGLGINLVAANRVVIFDVSWNPSHDVQSIFRVYRFGQKKPCYVYRFLAMGTMEEKIYERQVTKQAISKRVIDEQQIDRHYTEHDLQELYIFQPQPDQPRPVPLLPKDRLFAEMLKDHDKMIYRYHEHDSLLENKEEETLTEEERKAAWEDFENEKNRPPPVPFANTGFMPQMNGMNNMMQQQQLMLATMLSVLRKDYPGLTEQQIANILPQILYGDPALMQKMRILGGMAPNMGGMGPSSLGGGFPPSWQQQQMLQHQRLQQHQQQALANQGGGPGVKYYAGGLGSRDPLSMALQQKHQREMMLSSTGDQLRDMLVGAVPGVRRLPASTPAPHTNEVVTLDDSE